MTSSAGAFVEGVGLLRGQAVNSTTARGQLGTRAVSKASRGVITRRSSARSEHGTGATSRTFTLSPSDFAFLWEECPRCFYHKVHGILYRPKLPFPSIFNKIDLEMRGFFRGRRTEDIFPGRTAPRGEFLCEEEDAWVESLPIHVPDHPKVSVTLRGKIDCLLRLDDGTYAVIDFKTSNVDAFLAKYDRQLQAYAHAIENPSPNGDLEKLNVSRLGLVVYEPNHFRSDLVSGRPQAGLGGSLTYIERPKDTPAFMSFLGSVVDVLDRDEAPPPARGMKAGCTFCAYIEKGSAIVE